MGISKDAVKLLIHEAKREAFKGSALMLGKQNVKISEKELELVAKQLNFTLFDGPNMDPLSRDPGLHSKGCISDSYLFARLGFMDCKAIDYSDFEGAEHVFDLNKIIDQESQLMNSYDFIFDSGTLEHIFHLPNALRNIFSMLKIDGRICHLVPSSNHMNHGFHMFSPLFFEEYYEANKFSISDMQIIKCGSGDYPAWKIAKYQSQLLERVTNEDFGRRCYMVHCIATKTGDSSADVVPQQKRYSAGVWLGQSSADQVDTVWGQLKKKIRGNRVVYAFTAPVFNWLRRKLYAYQFRSGFKSIDAHCMS